MEISGSEFPFDKYCRQDEYLSTRNFNFPGEFAKKRPAAKRNPFQAYFPNPDNAAFSLERSPLESSFARWIRILEKQSRPATTVANNLLKDKYKLKFSKEDIRTKPIPPRHNLELLREPFGVSTSNGEAFGNFNDDQPRRGMILPSNKIDLPIGKFLMRNGFREFSEEDEEYRKMNLNPPAELIQVFKGNFDKEAKFQKAFKEWMGILTKTTVEKKIARQKQRLLIEALNERPESTPRWNASNENCYYCRRPPIMPRHQISPLRGPLLSSTHYEREFADKGCQLRQPIPPRDGISPPHGALRSATHYSDQYAEKGYSRRDYLIPPGGISPPHGPISSNTCYAQEFAEKNYSKRDPTIPPDAMSPPHGAVNSSTAYAEFFPERDYSRRDTIVLPGGISPPHGAMQSATSYARDYQECGHCRREYIVPPGGISPPHGPIASATSYNHDFIEREYCYRQPEQPLDTINPPHGYVEDETSYRQAYKECKHCKSGSVTASTLAELGSPVRNTASFDANNLTAIIEEEVKPVPDAGFPQDEHKPSAALSLNDLNDDRAIRVENGGAIWTVEYEQDFNTDISNEPFFQHLMQKRMGGGTNQPRTKHKKRARRKVERVNSPISPQEVGTSPPRSPNPPTRMKGIFASSYSRDFVAGTMGNLL
ncbi:Hypothetical predicted protein [Cloeon dipterum]|uniref:Uncharacterized protein n=1 Tax=Cloeon dipterum TaxID=197152 RepID=A0A8S1D7E9_9INSE|nr:Hypothetical predicted protein [Cloeon dipterum]